MLAQLNTSNGISLHLSSPKLFPSPPQPPLPSLLATTKSLSNHRFLFELRPFVCSSRRWDSNAESLRNFNFEYNDDDEDEDDENYEEMKQWTEVFVDYIDSIWIFKILWLDASIYSLLIASSNGFKSFSYGVSAAYWAIDFFFAFQRLWDRGKNRPKRKTKTKKGRSRPRPRTVKLNEEWGGSQGTTKKRSGYQSWIPRNDVSDKSSDEDAYSFGGWDELDREEESKESSRRRGARPERRSAGKFTEKGKSSQGEMPLLLRLLIAVFPFLGSFTKML